MIASDALGQAEHNIEQAADFLAVLDPVATKFTFQFFGDAAEGFAEIRHGSLDEVWPRIVRLNTSAKGVGVFVTVNETDFGGRRRENIVRARALFVDADDADQVRRCEDAVASTGATPTMIVRSSPHRSHFYWCCDDLGLADFTTLQSALIERLATDPAVKDLPRVMRLPGTFNLKNPVAPEMVRFISDGRHKRWKAGEIVGRLNLTVADQGPSAPVKSLPLLGAADRARIERIFGPVVDDALSSGIEADVEEIRAAVSAIPPSAIAAEGNWVRVARSLAHQASIFDAQSEEIWSILDEASARAPGYHREENRARWLRYVDEALDRDAPITIATVFGLARSHGWDGTVTLRGNALQGPVSRGSTDLRVSFSGIPHRRWLYGVDLVRGEITLLAAPGGVGKSSLAIGMSTGIATGKDLLGERICGDKLTALYINAEDSSLEMRRRIWAFSLQHQIAENDLGRFLLLGSDALETQRLSFLRPEKGASVLDQAGVAHLEAMLAEHRPDVVVLDPLIAMCGGGNLNDNAAMALVMRALKKLANQFDCAILVLHHTRKGGDLGNAEAIGGASAIVNLARRALMAVPMQSEEATNLGILPSERPGYFKLVASKSNLAPRSDNVPWYQLCNVTLPNAEPPVYVAGDGVQAVRRVALPRTNNSPAGQDLTVWRAILDTVARGKVIDGQRASYSPNTTGARNERALIPDAMVAVEAATAPRVWHEDDLHAIVLRAVGALKSKGWLVEEEIKAGRFRRCRGLRSEWSSTPWAADHAEKIDPEMPVADDVPVAD